MAEFKEPGFLDVLFGGKGKPPGMSQERYEQLATGSPPSFDDPEEVALSKAWGYIYERPAPGPAPAPVPPPSPAEQAAIDEKARQENLAQRLARTQELREHQARLRGGPPAWGLGRGVWRGTELKGPPPGGQFGIAFGTAGPGIGTGVQARRPEPPLLEVEPERTQGLGRLRRPGRLSTELARRQAKLEY